MSKQKSIPQRDAIPQEYTWNTADLYPTDEAWKEEFQTLKSLTQKLEGYAGRLGESAQTLYDFVTLEQQAGEMLSKLMDYAQRKSDEDTRVATYQAMVGQISTQYVELVRATAFEVPELLALPEERLEEFYAQLPELTLYRRYFHNIQRRRPHTLSQAEEQLLSTGQEEALDGAVEFYYENDLSTKLVEPLLEEIAQASGVHLYTVWELFLIQAAKPAREGYLEKGVPEDIVWDTWEDLKYKAIECKNVQGVWGNFVAHWYPIFFSNDIVKLGRLEYENVTYEGEVPYEKNGCVVRPGDKVKSVHIPSSGEPFDQAARLASYKKAYEFFKEELQGGPLVCVCGLSLIHLSDPTRRLSKSYAVFGVE